MTSPALPPLTRHHAPEAAYALGAALAVVTTNAAVMGIFWLRREQASSDLAVAALGVLAAAMLVATAVLAVRHPMARRAAVGALSVSLVVDAVLIGYELSETTILGAL